MFGVEGLDTLLLHWAPIPVAILAAVGIAGWEARRYDAGRAASRALDDANCHPVNRERLP